ncbi:hypothetical protein EV401DRAFT_2010276, partial [Pisolithus croceorrhizus]
MPSDSTLSYSLGTLSKLFAAPTHGRAQPSQSARPSLSHCYIISVPLKPRPSVTNFPANVPESMRKSPTFVPSHRQGSRRQSGLEYSAHMVDESIIEWNITTYQMASFGTGRFGLHHTQRRDLRFRTQENEVSTPSALKWLVSETTRQKVRGREGIHELLASSATT